MEDLSSAAYVRTFFSFFSYLVVAMCCLHGSSCIARKDYGAESSRAVGTPKTLQEFGVKGSYVRAGSKTRVCRQGVSRDVNASKEVRRVVVMGTLRTKVLAEGG